MANTSATFDLPAPITVLAGTKLVSEEDSVEALGLLNNWLMARGGAGTPLVEQGWQGAAHQRNGAAITSASWRVPTVSGAHTKVDVVVRYTQTAVVGQIRVLSATAGGAVAAATVIGGPADLTLAGLAVAPSYDDVSLELTSVAGNLTIHDVMISAPYLADPLPAAAIDGASPMGAVALSADRSHNARINRDARVNAPVLRQRPRVLACWSGLDPAVGQETLRSGMAHRTLVRTWEGSRAYGITYNAHAYVRNVTGAAQRLVWHAGPLGAQNGNHVVVVGAGFTGWKTTTLTLPDLPQIQGYPWEATSVGLDLGIDGYPTTCEVLRYTIWGE